MKQGIIYFLSYTRGGGAHEGLNDGGKQLLLCRFGQMLGSGLNLQMVPNKSNVIILINDNKWDLLK